MTFYFNFKNWNQIAFYEFVEPKDPEEPEHFDKLEWDGSASDENIVYDDMDLDSISGSNGYDPEDSNVKENSEKVVANLDSTCEMPSQSGLIVKIASESLRTKDNSQTLLPMVGEWTKKRMQMEKNFKYKATQRSVSIVLNGTYLLVWKEFSHFNNSYFR